MKGFCGRCCNTVACWVQFFTNDRKPLLRTHKHIHKLFMHFSFSSLSPSSRCNYSDSSAKHVDSAINSFFAFFFIEVHFSSFLLRNSTCNDMPAVRLNRPPPNIDWSVCEHTGVCVSVSVVVDRSACKPLQASRPLGCLVHTCIGAQGCTHTSTGTPLCF